MKAIFLTAEKKNLLRVYGKSNIEKLTKRYEMPETVFQKKDLEARTSALDAEIIFSTWGMEHFLPEEIRRFFPKVKYVFYAAGSVKHFAKEFLAQGIRVFSARQENAVPVAEYTAAAVLLSAKGVFRAAGKSKKTFYAAGRFATNSGGIYGASAGVIGAGVIGKMVAERLHNSGMKIYCYDPYLSEEQAEKLGVIKADLETLFSTCDVISNHLPDLDALAGVLNGVLFSRMKPYSTFINTGRGRQVEEKGLIKALRKDKTRTALLDVTHPEPPRLYSPLRYMKNVILTPHIAGSLGREVLLMSDAMIVCCQNILCGEKDPHEITQEMLDKMA